MFVAQHKGKGLSMTQLSELYRKDHMSGGSMDIKGKVNQIRSRASRVKLPSKAKLATLKKSTLSMWAKKMPTKKTLLAWSKQAGVTLGVAAVVAALVYTGHNKAAAQKVLDTADPNDLTAAQAMLRSDAPEWARQPVAQGKVLDFVEPPEWFEDDKPRMWYE